MDTDGRDRFEAAVVEAMTLTAVEVRGCVLRSGAFTPETFEQWWSATGGDRRAIEGVINHLHIWDLDLHVDAPDDEPANAAAEAIATAWRARLAETFPTRAFEVEITDDYGPTITFFSLDP